MVHEPPRCLSLDSTNTNLTRGPAFYDHSAPAKSLSGPLRRRSRILHSETARARIYGVRIMLESMTEALASS